MQRIHLDSKELVRLADINTIWGEGLGDIAFHPDGSLYAVRSRDIFILDSLTGTFDLVYTTPEFISVGLSIDHQGLFYLGGGDQESWAVATFDPSTQETRVIARFGEYALSRYVNDLDFYDGALYLMGQLPSNYTERAIIYKVDTTGADLHDTIIVHEIWPTQNLAAYSDSCGSTHLVAITSSRLNYYFPDTDSLYTFAYTPPPHIISAGSSSRTSWLGSIPPLRITGIDIAQNPCDTTGEATISVHIREGRPPAVEYSLDGINYQDSAVFHDIPPGVYQAFIRDDWGCSEMSDPFEVPVIPVYPVTLSVTPATCGEDNAVIDVSSVDTQLEYSLDGNTYSSTEKFTGLPAGTYILYVRNTDGCVDSTEIIIDFVPAPDATVSAAETRCDTHTGLLTITATSGSPPYMYALDALAWQDESQFDSLAAGDYTVYVRDAMGCILTIPAQILPADDPAITDVLLTHPECGDPTGSITITATGAGTLTYALNGGAPVSASVFTGLPQGQYLLSVTDGNGCTATQEIVLTTTDGPQILDVTVAPAHCDQDDGQITISATGGGTLNYALDGGSASGSHVFADLAPGSYTIIVSDSDGCTALATAQVDEIAAALILALDTEDATCGEPNGRIAVTGAQGENILYSLDRLHWQINPVFDFLDGGAYTVYLNSYAVCIDSAVIEIVQFYAPEITDIAITPAGCHGDDGTADVTIEGGTPPIVSALSGLGPSDQHRFTGLAPGDYLLSLSDANGCMADAVITIPSGVSAIFPPVTVMPARCVSASGSIEIHTQVHGAEYFINGDLNNSTGYFPGLTSGVYHLLIRDSDDCVLDTMVHVPLLDCDIYLPNVFTPNGDGINDLFGPLSGTGMDILSFEIFDRWGNTVYTCSDFSHCQWDGMSRGQPAPAGVYVYTIRMKGEDGEERSWSGDVMLVR